MVSWSADGTLAGYSGASGKLIANAFLFASPGSVDLNGSSRLHYQLPAGTSVVTYPNRITATASFTFVAGDFTANPGKKLSAAMFIAPASAFAAGVVPTPAQILALGSALTVSRASAYVTSAQTITFQFPYGPYANATFFQPNSKYWILIMPTALTDANSEWSFANDKVMAGVTVNTIGRALSLWTNRTPAVPVITSPATGSVVAGGNTIPFAYTPGDPDSVTPNDATKRNKDLAGVQVQYAPVSVPGGPAVEWIDLPIRSTVGTTEPGWYIRGSRNSDSGFGLGAILDNLGFPIMCGSSVVPALNGFLAGGDWQIRCRTFDFGHPYPNNFGALGLAAAGVDSINATPSNYPALNTSPWSAAVTISVPAQVPPPTPLSPTTGLARPVDIPIRCTWKYRNTFLPPYAQRRRWVQVREVGSPSWSTLFAGPSVDPFVDLLPSYTAPAPVADSEYQGDLGFEANTLGGWVATLDPSFPLEPAPTRVNVNDATKAHAGSRYLSLDYTGQGWPSLDKEYVGLNASHDSFRLRGWIYPVAVASNLQITAVWKDIGGSFMFSSAKIINVTKPLSGWGWTPLDVTLVRPVGGVTLYVQVLAFGVGITGFTGTRIDDFSLVGSCTTNTDSFEIDATKNYEWRVKVEDDSLVQSQYSLAASFWVIPGAGSGGVRPIPSSTIEGATLGCGKHRAFVYRRGGLVRVGEIKFKSYLDWGRVRDDISTSKIVVSGWDIDCGNLLSILQTWAYEIVIFRDTGDGLMDRVWEGPITLLTYERDSVTIHAKDVMGYAYRRIIKQKMTDSGVGNGTTVVNRAMRVLQNAFAPDDPNVLAYLNVLARDDDAMQYRSTPAYSRTAFEEVDDMAANAGLDYTAVGRSILLWGTKHRIGTLPEFGDDDLGSPPIVSEYGMSMANRYVVSDGNGVWGEATRLDVSGNDEIYGLVEMLSSSWASDTPSDTGTYTQAGLQTVIDSFEGYAERSIADRYGPGAPVVVRVPDNTTLNPSAVISIQQLVPGVVIPLRSTGTLRSAVASQKLDSVTVVEEGGTETISITLSPFSRDDTAVGEEEE